MVQAYVSFSFNIVNDREGGFMAKNNNTKLIHYKKEVNKAEFNIGLFMFGIIFIYLVISIMRYFSTEHTLVYEVRKGSIMQDNVYTGLVMRHETVVKAPDEGFIQYYYTELSRVGIGHNIFTLSMTDDEQLTTSLDNPSGTGDLTVIEENDIKAKIQLFNSTYTESSFGDAYRLKTEIDAILNSNDNQERIKILNAIAGNSSGHNVYKTEKSGILLYEIDGYEDLEESDISADSFDKSKYNKQLVVSGAGVSEGDNIYKLVDDELWSIYIPLNDSDINNLNGINLLEVRCIKDDLILPADFSIIQLNGRNYGKLDLNEGMIRYATDRFLEIELIVDNLEGFKLPLTTVIQKNFYSIPIDFLTVDSDSNKTGVYTKENDSSTKFVELNIFYRNEEFAYVPTENISLNSVLIQKDTNESFIVADTAILDGVYNVTRGYAIFKYVNILNTSTEYYIVQEGAYQSINNYDYIALNGLSVNEGDFIY